MNAVIQNVRGIISVAERLARAYTFSSRASGLEQRAMAAIAHWKELEREVLQMGEMYKEFWVLPRKTGT